jgi:hypothetical protein
VVSDYAAAVASRSGFYVALLAAFSVAVATLLLGSAPVSARRAFAQRLAVGRSELLFVATLSLVGAAVGFATILLIG